MTGAANTHLVALQAAITTAMAAKATTEVVKDRPALNIRDAMVAALDAAVHLENWSDLP